SDDDLLLRSEGRNCLSRSWLLVIPRHHGSGEQPVTGRSPDNAALTTRHWQRGTGNAALRTRH
ncbi:MAG: hypothetical protein ACPGXX_21775, partial [Planctomycetaceae bacterium]